MEIKDIKDRAPNLQLIEHLEWLGNYILGYLDEKI